jgi:NifU-like protein involved in Fe-S cluster formation
MTQESSIPNLGELKDADVIGVAGSPGCGDMLKMWVKFREENGEKVIDQATFQSFGCETAIAVASAATNLIKGKTIAEALLMKSDELSAPLGPLPPMKIHCAALVEEALHKALDQVKTPVPTEEEGCGCSVHQPNPNQNTLKDSMAQSQSVRTIKIVRKNS